MEPLFQTETEYTYDEYKKYNHEILYKVRKVSRTILIMELILLAVAYMAKDLTYVVAALCVPLIFSIVFFIKAKSTYKKNPDIHNVISFIRIILSRKVLLAMPLYITVRYKKYWKQKQIFTLLPVRIQD